MRRVLRWTFNGLTTLSLLLCMATVVLWARSHYSGDVIRLVERRHAGDRKSVSLTQNMFSSSHRGLCWINFQFTAEGQRAELWMAMIATNPEFDVGWHWGIGPTGPTLVARSHTSLLYQLGFQADRNHDEQELSMGDVRPGPKLPGADWGITDTLTATAPHWSIFLMTSAIPIWWLGRIGRQ